MWSTSTLISLAFVLSVDCFPVGLLDPEVVRLDLKILWDSQRMLGKTIKVIEIV